MYWLEMQRKKCGMINTKFLPVAASGDWIERRKENFYEYIVFLKEKIYEKYRAQ